MSKPAPGLEARSAAEGDAAETPAERMVRAFNEVRDELVSTLWYILGSRDDAQDTAQEAFLKCWRTRDGLAEVRNLRAWIFRVGLNAAKDLQRNAWRKRSRPLLGNPAQETAAACQPVEVLEHKEDMHRLREALLGLRPEEKAVFLLRQNADLTYEEIAELRRCPVGTVKTQMRTALQKLRKVLQDK